MHFDYRADNLFIDGRSPESPIVVVDWQLAMWGLGGAAIQALMTKRVSAYEQGQLQGANASLVGIANMIGPVIFTVTYARAIESSFGPWLSGVPFLLAAAFLAAAMIIGARVTKPG